MTAKDRIVLKSRRTEFIPADRRIILDQFEIRIIKVTALDRNVAISNERLLLWFAP